MFMFGYKCSTQRDTKEKKRRRGGLGRREDNDAALLLSRIWQHYAIIISTGVRSAFPKSIFVEGVSLKFGDMEADFRNEPILFDVLYSPYRNS